MIYVLCGPHRNKNGKSNLPRSQRLHPVGVRILQNSSARLKHPLRHIEKMLSRSFVPIFLV
jgi:hypothetical protein